VGPLHERRGGISQGGIGVWHPDAGPYATLLPRHLEAIADGGGLEAVAVSAGGRFVVGHDRFPSPCGAERDVVVWDLETGEIERPSPFGSEQVVAMSADGRAIALDAGTPSSTREIVRLARDGGGWQTLRIAPPIPAGSGTGQAVHRARAMSPDGRLIAAYSSARHPD